MGTAYNLLKECLDPVVFVLILMAIGFFVSLNTKEHAEELNKKFNNKDLRIGLITSAYHMQRSNREFRKYFRNVEPLPSDYLYSPNPISLLTFLPHSSKLNTFSIAFREIIGIAWYKII